MIDYICVSAQLENRVIEFADHLHEHFLDPVTLRDGKYTPPLRPGFSIEMKKASLDSFEYPTGSEWNK